MKLKSTLVILVSLWLIPTSAQAADKTHQQMMAEIRMLQEQQAQLQQMLRGLADTLKTMTAKIDEQTGAMRKGFADQKLVVDGIAEGVRVLREKADDTNVRLSTMTQEIEAMRRRSSRRRLQPPPAGVTGDPPRPADWRRLPRRRRTAGPACRRARLDAAFNDYTSGQYDLAIAGFEFYISGSPPPRVRYDAQLNIGNSHYAMGNYREAVTAFQKVISDYAQSDQRPQAWYKLGLSYEALKQIDLARRATRPDQESPRCTDATLAKQRLDSLNKKQN